MNDNWMFLHVADMQPGSPRSFRFEPAYAENWRTARGQILQVRPELLLVGGDLTRDGSIHPGELLDMKGQLDAMPFPVHVIPGNMDTGNKHARQQGGRSDRDDLSLNVTSAQLERFAGMFGPLQWSFVHRDVRFSGFYGALAGSDLPAEGAMWEWLESLAAEPRAWRHVVIMHYPLFFDRMDEPAFDITDPDQYFRWYFSIDHPHRERVFDALKAAGADIVISGHIHCRKVDVVDGIRFIKSPATSLSQMGHAWPDGDPRLGFLRFDVSGDGLRETFIPLRCEAPRRGGYGPGGHPRVTERDYTLAIEQPPFTPIEE